MPAIKQGFSEAPVLEPRGDRVLIKRVKARAVTEGGIVIPQTSQDKPQEAIVLAVGPGRRYNNGEIVPIDLRPGQRVLVSKYSGTEIEIDGQAVLVLNSEDVLGVFREAR
jgi:chaperonin GroES